MAPYTDLVDVEKRIRAQSSLESRREKGCENSSLLACIEYAQGMGRHRAPQGATGHGAPQGVM